MRFVKIFILTVMLFFSYGVMAQSNTTARQVSKEVTINNASAPNIGEDKWKGFLGDTEARVAAGGMGLGAGALTAAGALAMTGVGIPVALGIGAVVGLISAISTYNFSHEAPVCSFNETLGAFYSLNHGSWLSPVFNMLFNAINSLAVAVNGGELADWTIKILALMMAFYLLFTAIKYIVSFSPIEPVKFLSEILFPLGRVIIAVWAIKNWNYIFQNILSPILDLAINFGSEILHVTGRTETYTASVSGGIQPVDAVCTETMKGQGLNVSVCNSIQTFLATISANLLTWMAFGATLIKDCWAKGFGNIFPSFKMLILGILFFIFSFLVYISFPLKLLDTMFRLMFIVILFPLWCVFWVIPQTREYFKKMVNMLINVLATFLSASVVMVMVITILSNLFDSVPLDKIIELLQEDKSEDAMNLIGFSSSGLFYSVCLLFMAFHLVGKVEYFANFFAKQDSFGAGAALSGMTTMAITKGVPSAFGIGKNTTKWTAGKIKGGIDRFRAKSYNSRAPGGKDKNGAPARQSPRFWTAAIPGTGLWDAHKAKKQIGGYTRTTEVKTGWLEKAKDGSTSQTYSNKTVDKNGSIKTQMHETTLGNKDKSKQTVDRHVQHFDATGCCQKRFPKR